VSPAQPSKAFDLPVLLDILSYTDGEFVSIGHDGNDDGEFTTAVTALADAGGYVTRLADTANVYFGVNPTRGPARNGGGRGAAKDITRLAALWSDLDVKPGGCPDLQTAQAIISELSSILGTRPSAVTYSGGGCHPYWPFSDDEDAIELSEAAALVRRFGRLVKAVAQSHGAVADSVFDLARMLRVPGTHNNKAAKNGQCGALVRTLADCGGPLTVAEIGKRLNEFGIYTVGCGHLLPKIRTTCNSDQRTEPRARASRSAPTAARFGAVRLVDSPQMIFGRIGALASSASSAE